MAPVGGIELTLHKNTHVGTNRLTVADIAFTCEIALLSNEIFMKDTLAKAGLEALLPRLAEYQRIASHLRTLAAHPHFATDLSRYYERMEFIS